MPTRTFALGAFLGSAIWTIATSGLLLIPDTAAAQALVRMNRGSSVTIYPGNARYRIGQSHPQRAPREVTLEGNPVAAICCPGRSRASCVTERQVSLGASRASVLGRYGRPGAESSREVRYSGVSFELDRSGRVDRICIRRR
jgi:hypothetical protein